MFDTHQPLIAHYGQASSENMARVLQFVLLTARVPLHRVPGDMRQVDKRGDRAISILFGWKLRAWQEVREKRASIYADAMEAASLADPERREYELLATFANLHGLGLVKGGFCTQLLFGVVGCLDTHNIDRFHLNVNDLRSRKELSVKARERRARTYLEMTRNLGGCEALWNGWCAYLAEREPVRYNGADHVSALHCEALGV